MILNIFGNQNKITQLPYHEFNWDEQIAVKKIIIEWISTKAITGIVQSDLVDKNPFNPNQQLCSFTKSEGSTLTEICFSDPVFYGIQKHSLHDATFSIKSLFDDEILQVKHIHIQLMSK